MPTQASIATPQWTSDHRIHTPSTALKAEISRSRQPRPCLLPRLQPPLSLGTRTVDLRGHSWRRPNFAVGMPSSRPYTPNQAQFDTMHNYAYRYDLQTLLNRMLADTFNERPEKLIPYLKKWLDTEGEAHVAKALERFEQESGAK